MKLKMILFSMFVSLVWLNTVSAKRQAPSNKQNSVSSAAMARMTQAYEKLPLAFEANHGHSDSRVKFLTRGAGYALFLTDKEAVLKLQPADTETQNSRDTVFKMRLTGAKTSPNVIGVSRLPGKNNYFLGNDPGRWQTDVENFAGVKYEAVYPGVDLIWHGNQRQIEYDFELAPGAKAEKIRMFFDGAQTVKLDADGSLILFAEGRNVRMLRPVAWQEVDGQRCEISCNYRLNGSQVGFQVGKYDTNRSLVIDPVLVYSTFIGGAGMDDAFSIAVDSEGSAYLVGSTDSADFPGTSPIQQVKAAQTEAFVLKLNPAGNTVVYATWLGGSGGDVATRVIVDAAGSVVVTGSTSSPDFPLKDALQTTRGGASDAFVTRLNPAGSALIYSTLLGGSGSESGNGVALDASGNLYLMGNTDSLDFPTANPMQSKKQGNALYVSTSSAATWNVASNGLAALQTNDLAVDPTNPAIVYAATERGVFKTVNGGAVWTKASSQFSLSTSQLVIDPTAPMTIYAIAFSTLYKSADGGNSWNTLSGAGPILSLAIAPTTPVTLYAATINTPLKSADGGMTWTQISTIRPPFGGTARIRSFAIDPLIPTTVYAGGLQAVYKTTDAGANWQSLVNGFPQSLSFTVSRLFISRNNQSVLFALIEGGVYRTTNSGGNWEAVTIPTATFFTLPALAIDPMDANTVYAGTSNGGVFKSTNGGMSWLASGNGLKNINVRALAVAGGSPQTVYAGTFSGSDLFLAKINAAGTALIYSTYLGGSDQDSGGGLAVDANGNAYLAGTTQSKDFPTATPYQASLKGFSDAFALKVNPAGSALVWSTYLGGDGTDSGNDLTINNAGNPFIAGTTNSANFPTVNAAQPARNSTDTNTNDAFITKFSGDGRTLEYSTYLGGSRYEFAGKIVVDAANNAYVTGTTNSEDFPLVGAPQTIIDRNPETITNPNLISGDAFVTRLSADGRTFVYSTFMGGRGFDQGNAIAVDAMGNAYVAGSTRSADFPLTQNPLRATFSVSEAFVTKLAISADLSVAINDEPDPVQVNNNLSYSVTVANDGPDAAANVTTIITLQQGVMVVSVNTSQGSCGGGGPINCAFGNMAVGAKARITVVIKPTVAENVSVQATTASSTPDINNANNSASQTTKVSTLPSIFGRVAAASGAALSGVAMNLTGAQRPVITTLDDGRYQFAELAAGGNYIVTPSRQGYVFNPASRSLNNLTSDQRGDFSAVACVFSIAPSNRVFQPIGGAGSVTVNSSDSQCPWIARSNVAWIKLEGAVNGVIGGNGSRVISFTVEPTVGARSGAITIAGQTFTVLQEFNACPTADFSTSPISQLEQAGYLTQIMTADFTNDGLLDLAAINNNRVGSQIEATLLIYPGNSSGGFAAPIKAMKINGAEASLQTFAAGDLNGDGFPDLVATGGQNQNRIFVVPSNGAGGFFGFREYAATLPLSSIAIGDFNSDNKSDVAFGVRSSDANVIVRFNDGTGNLGSPKTLPRAGGNSPAYRIEASDFDGDNKLDILSFSGGPEFVIFKNDGAGNFSAQPYSLSISAFEGIVSDFNGDRRPDILFAFSGGLILYLNNGSGVLGEPIRTYLSVPFSGYSVIGSVAGDFNGDGKTDAAISPNGRGEGMAVFLSLGGGAFSSPIWYTFSLAGSGSTTPMIAAGDFNRDGLSDLALATNNNSADSSSVTIIRARQDDRFEAARAYSLSINDNSSQPGAGAVAVGDLNGDGLIDLASGSSDQVFLLFGNGRGELSDPVGITVVAGSAIGDIAIRDFNRDGKNDLAVVISGNTIVILLGDGRAGFTRSTFLNTGETPRQLVVADFNNDGKLDIVARGQSGRFEGGLTLFLGDGNGGFAVVATDLGGSFNPFNLQFAAGDFNGDGNADLLINDKSSATSLGPRVITLLGDGKGGFGAAKSFKTDSKYLGYEFVLTGDVNYDGRSDLIFSPAYIGSLVGVQISLGDGTFAAPVEYPVGSSTRSAVIQDVNNDGILDVVAASQEANKLYVLSGKGDGSFKTPYTVPMPGLSYFVGSADFNSDGVMDLVVNRQGSAFATILLNRASCPLAGAAVATSAASYVRHSLATESIAAVFGAGLASTTQVATGVPLPTQLAGTTIKIKDSAGVERTAPLFFASPNQINFQIPLGAAAGTAVLSVINGDNSVAAGTMAINRIAPALFSADSSGQGFASAVVLRIKPGGKQTFEPVTTMNAMGQIVGVPIDLSIVGDQVFLLLFGSGIRANTGLTNLSVKINGTAMEVQYAGAQGDFVGLDQINLRLPSSLGGKGMSSIVLIVDGKAANSVRINIK